MKKLRYIAVFLMILFFMNSIIYAVPKPGEIINMPPTIDLSVRPKKKPVDIVIMTDYSGTKLAALNNQINLLKAKFENVNVDPVFHVINDMKKIGTQNDAIHMYRRYGIYKCTVSQYSNWGSAGDHYSFDVKYSSDIVWEERESLVSQATKLPKRSPQNVYFTKTNIKSEETSSRYKEYYTVTIRCTNDIKTSGTTNITTYQTYYLTGSGFERSGIYNEKATVSSTWSKEEKISDIIYDVYSIDFDKLSTLSIRDGSDRYMMFISDGAVKDYSKPSGSYFSFGDLTEQVSQYIKDNKFTAIGVVPDGIKNMWMLNDKVTEIEPFLNYTNFKLIDGSWKKIGGTIYNSLPYDTLAYPEPATNVDNIKNIKKVIGNYVLFKDGKLRYCNEETDTFTRLPRLPDGITFDSVSDIYKSDDYSNFICIELPTKEVYLYHPNDVLNTVKKLTALSGINKFADYDIILDKTGKLFCLSVSGERAYDRYGNVIGYKYTPALKRISQKWKYDSYNNEVYSSIPAIKDMKIVGASYNRLIYALLNDGTLVFTGIDWEYDDNDNLIYYLYDWVDNNKMSIPYKIIDTNVKEFYLIGGLAFYKKIDDTESDNYKFAGVYKYQYDCHEDDDGDYHCRTGYRYKPTTDSGMKTIIQPSSTYETLTIDVNNNLYIHTGFNWLNNAITTPQYHKIGTFDLDNVYVVPFSSSNYHKFLIKTVSGESYTFAYYKSSYYSFTGTGMGLVKLPKNIRYVKISPDNKTLYVSQDDGTVRGYGYTETGQLGIKKSITLQDIDPFVNDFVLTDKTKEYITLNVLFKGNLENKFYPVGQYATALNDIYMKYENTSGTGNMYILLGDEIEYLPSVYNDREKDPEYQKKWIISHDPNYFDNSMGLSIYHNPTGVNTNPPTKFDKVGKYIINLKARDNPKNNNLFDNYRLWSTGNQNLTLYVHRKPIALMNLSVTQNADETYKIIATDGGSYDKDHTSLANKGIVAFEWAWRDQWEDSWHYERMNKLDATGDRAYIVSLRVKDMEGVWSDWIYQTIDNRQPPIAKFDIAQNPISSIELAQIKDTSYSIMSNLTNWHWIVKKINADGTIGTTLQEVKPTNSNAGAGGYDTNLNLTKTNPGVGQYRIYLRVKADNGLWSDGGTDAAANISKMFYRDLTVNQALSIGDVSIAGRWNHFRGWTDKFGVWKDVMKDTTYVDENGVTKYPYRFLSYEKVDITIKLEGYADNVIIDFPDGLDRMTYTDKLGYTYSYNEDVGYTLAFPYEIAINPTLKDPIISWSYILPLVDSSATWKNVRLKQPYTITVKAVKGTFEVTQTKKIDITGNVDDLIFIQPVEK